MAQTCSTQRLSEFYQEAAFVFFDIRGAFNLDFWGEKLDFVPNRGEGERVKPVGTKSQLLSNFF